MKNEEMMNDLSIIIMKGQSAKMSEICDFINAYSPCIDVKTKVILFHGTYYGLSIDRCFKICEGFEITCVVRFFNYNYGKRFSDNLSSHYRYWNSGFKTYPNNKEMEEFKVGVFNVINVDNDPVLMKLHSLCDELKGEKQNYRSHDIITSFWDANNGRITYFDRISNFRISNFRKQMLEKYSEYIPEYEFRAIFDECMNEANLEIYEYGSTDIDYIDCIFERYCKKVEVKFGKYVTGDL